MWSCPPTAQKEKLFNGGKIQLKRMTGRNDKKFSATLQVDPAGRNIGFSDFKQEKADQKQSASESKKQGKGIKAG